LTGGRLIPFPGKPPDTETAAGAELVPAGDDDAQIVPVDEGGVIPGVAEERIKRGDRQPYDLTPLRVKRGELVKRPIVAKWVTDAQERRDAAAYVWTRTWRTAVYHLLRIPQYSGKVAVYSPRGGWRAAVRMYDWVGDAEGRPLRHYAVTKEDISGYMVLVRERNDRVRRRLFGTLGCVAGLLAGLWVASLFWPWTWPAALAVAVAVTGRLGAPADRPIVTKAVLLPENTALTSDHVTRALGGLGIQEISKVIAKGKGIDFAAPIAQDGPGWRAEIDLPYGVTAAEVIDKREKLASGLRRPLGCVWPEPVPDEHEGRLLLWVGRRDMAKTPPPPWPLLKAGKVDLFDPFPFGTDPRGRVATLTLMFASMIIGSLPRMGKTFAMRLCLLAAALDVRCQIYAFDLKGTGDFSPVEPVSHRYRLGDDDADGDVEYGLMAMRELQGEMRRRTKVIAGLPKDICPENKVTTELADRRSLGLFPIAVGVDECQRWFEHPQFGKELEKICEDLVKRGPALGIFMLLGTQRPDAKSLPTGISANAVLRFCLKVTGQTENDMVLGTSMYKAGIRATVFSFKRDKGIGWLSGEDDDPRICRTFKVDNPTAEQVAIRARAMREEAGTLTGYALDEAPEQPRHDLLSDVRAVMAGEEKVRKEDILARLVELRKGIYGGWSGEQLTAALKPFGVSTSHQITRSQDGKTVNRRGVDLAELEAAMDRR
jgi:S-DNA-T family DNA segregation ATPase FtsK/SpoIIIE